MRFTSQVSDSQGTTYDAQACGSPMADGSWQGWIEFVPTDGGAPVRTPRETTQPNRTDTQYWATGLTTVYLEGALSRALKQPRIKVEAPSVKPSIFAGPAAHTVSVGTRDSVIDPFSVYEHGEAHLRKQLGAFAAWHLVNIARDFDLTDLDMESLNRMSASELIDLIVRGVTARSIDERAATRG